MLLMNRSSVHRTETNDHICHRFYLRNETPTFAVRPLQAAHSSLTPIWKERCDS